MSRIAPILMILTYALLGLLTNVAVCASIGSEVNFRYCMSEEILMVFLFWPVVLVGTIMLNPIPFVLINVVLVVLAWMLLRSLKKAKLKSA